MRSLLTLLLALAPVSAWSATADDFLFRTYNPGGAHPLPYRLLVPPGYSNANAYPLIIFLHGSGEKGTDNTAQLNYNANGALALVSSANQAAYPCFMLCPQAHPTYNWNETNEAQIIAVIDQLLDAYSIDRDRIYVTGLSMGGGGTLDIVRRYPHRFACAVPQSGWDVGHHTRLATVPLWAFHAANDGDAGVGGTDSLVNGVRSAGGRVIYTRYDTGGHGIWPTAYAAPALLPWMMAQRRSQPVTGTPILRITSPSGGFLADAGATLDLSGSSAFPAGWTIGKAEWTTNLTAFTLASGTTSWSADDVAVANGTTRFSVLATAANGAPNNGVTTVNDSVRVVRGSGDATPPNITITSPVGATSVDSALVTVSGTASDSSGIHQVTWSNDRGGQGIAIGTTSWSIGDIALESGANVISVTARDGANRTATATITVTSTGTGGGGGGGGGYSGSSSGCGLGGGAATLLALLGLLLGRGLRVPERGKRFQQRV